MARIRSLKPSFFKSEDLAALSPWHRLCFEGLWCWADREGRLEDRPRRLKAEIFPYDDLEMEPLLDGLAKAGFILRYEVNGKRYVAIPTFDQHQIPTRDEPASVIPGPDGSLMPYEKLPNETVRQRIYQRDKYLCAYCSRDMEHDVRVRCLDHVIPYAHGGSNHPDNLVTACKKCNVLKRDRTPDEAGLAWPEGRGRLRDGRVVDGPLTVGQHSPDREREGERDREQEREGDSTRASREPSRRAEDLQELWNDLTKPPIPRCRELTPKRKRHIAARFRERTFEEWADVFRRVQCSAFCRGEVPANGRGQPWVASFDWIISAADNATKVLEGKYDDRPVVAKGGSLALGGGWECRHLEPCSNPATCQHKRNMPHKYPETESA